MADVVNERGDTIIVSLLHTISQFLTCLGRPPMQWDDPTFASKGDVVPVMIAVAYWDENYTHQIYVAHYVPTAAVINSALASDPNTLIIDSFNNDNTSVNAVRVLRNLYVPPRSYPSC